ncbi:MULTISPECIES: flagellar protein FlhE [unclassified Tatumella]|uniref:flagellar protein FlhE n=1 Tax=unclassified Tatumella TaxID=2649542 RepID=UPI001BAEB272|nr:flagellar protein FlhE [Tatumella sp. JGM16]MBS0895071.1 flagellar protein FlhE [Tatumella sp. JGM130]MBS0911649.1 flagellar protein FlhE [Tatumella sp. JGM91]
MAYFSRCSLLLLLVVAVRLPAADITLSGSLPGPAMTRRGHWVTTRPLNIVVPSAGNILRTGWYYQLTDPAPAGFQAQLCRGSDCFTLDGGKGAGDWFNSDRGTGPFYLRFRIQSSAVIPAGFRVVSTEVRVTYRQRQNTVR